MKKKRFFLVVAIVTIFGCSEQLSPPIDSISPPVLKKPSYLGWNSWNAFHVKINEQNVISNLDRFIRDLKPAGYEYFILDNGWDGAEEFGVHLDDYGRNLPHPISFPNGFDPIISKAQKSGVKFGLWMVRGVNKEAYRKNLSIEGTSYHFRDIVDTLILVNGAHRTMV